MAEEPVRIPVEDGKITIEGLFEQGRIGRNAVLCHPHPLYGGNMYNNVVQTARQAFAGLGWVHCASISGEQAPAAGILPRGSRMLKT